MSKILDNIIEHLGKFRNKFDIDLSRINDDGIGVGVFETTNSNNANITKKINFGSGNYLYDGESLSDVTLQDIPFSFLTEYKVRDSSSDALEKYQFNVTKSGIQLYGTADKDNNTPAEVYYIKPASALSISIGYTSHILKTVTLTDSIATYTLDSNRTFSDYDLLVFRMKNSNNVDFRTISVSAFTDVSTAASDGANLIDMYSQIGGTGRRTYVRYSSPTTFSAFCSINSGISLRIYGIKFTATVS